MKKVVVIGSGFSSLSAACYLGKMGYEVTLLEKNPTPGGRARQLRKEGFVFDMGPTFYWMPDIIDAFFADFNKKPEDYYHLTRLDPGYQVYFGEQDSLSIAAGMEKIFRVFEQEEPGSSKFLHSFLNEAGFNYRVAIDKVVYQPGESITELIMPETAARVLQFVESLKRRVGRGLKSSKLRRILEFPVLFLGAKPDNIPAFYCFMNYADMVLGTWHIEGGMYQLVKAMVSLAESYGVKIHTCTPVEEIVVGEKGAEGVKAGGNYYQADMVVSGADYHHTETLLELRYRNYTSRYWQKRVLAPSALMFYVAFDKKLENVSHHTLFFDSDFDLHARDIYDSASWPGKPLFYASFPSVTDRRMAPEGKEAGVFLIPVAPGLEDSAEIREHYLEQLIARLEQLTGQTVKESILFYESYGVTDFITDYNAYKGNAYGLSNILMQTAFLKPKMRNKRVPNLFYTGQLTVPGPGVPPAIISGKIVAELINTYDKER